MFDSPMLVPSLTGLAVLCGLAGGLVPRWGPSWGLVTAVPCFVTFFVRAGGPLTPVGFVLLRFGLLRRW